MTKFQNIYAFAFTSLLALAFVLAADLPRLFGFALVALAVIFTAFYYPVFKTRMVFPKKLWVVAAGIAGLAVASTLWSQVPAESLERSLKMSALLAGGFLLINLALQMPLEKFRPYLWLLPVSVALAALIITLDMKFDALVFRILRGVPADEVVRVHMFNRGTVCTALAFFPVFYILRTYSKSVKIVGLFLLSATAMFLTVDSQSAQLAFIVGGFFFLCFPCKYSWAWYGLIIVIATLIFAAPFLAIWTYHNFAADLNSLPFLGKGAGFAGGRLEIWDFVSRYALTNPLTGHGFEVTRTIDNFDSVQIFNKGTSTLHPHNFAIQLWMEFGVIGAAAGSALCTYLLLIIKKLPPQEARMTLATFMTALSISATGYGIWQSWWIGILCTAAALCILAIRLDRKQP